MDEQRGAADDVDRPRPAPHVPAQKDALTGFQGEDGVAGGPGARDQHHRASGIPRRDRRLGTGFRLRVHLERAPESVKRRADPPDRPRGDQPCSAPSRGIGVRWGLPRRLLDGTAPERERRDLITSRRARVPTVDAERCISGRQHGDDRMRLSDEPRGSRQRRTRMPVPERLYPGRPYLAIDHRKMLGAALNREVMVGRGKCPRRRRQPGGHRGRGVSGPRGKHVGNGAKPLGQGQNSNLIRCPRIPDRGERHAFSEAVPVPDGPTQLRGCDAPAMAG